MTSPNPAPDPQPPSRLRALPKAEIHVHLEGSMDAATLGHLATQAGQTLPRPAETLFQFAGLQDFLHFLDWACGLVRTREQLATIAYAFAQRMAASGTGYADVIVNPTHWSGWRDRPAEMVAGLDDGFSAAEQDGLPPVGLCISLLRTQTAAQATDLLDTLLALGHPRVVALSIDGNEALAGRTGPRFAEVFRKAGAQGLRRTVHAGESSGSEGVRDAIDLLGADRIDHGVRAIEDPALVAELAERGIALGVAPGSNLALGVYPSIDAHPIERLRRAGVKVSVNTDDPALFATSLEEEYARCVRAFGWDTDALRAVAQTSIDASFAPAALKQRLSAALASWPD
jgi:adenosine deaminase